MYDGLHRHTLRRGILGEAPYVRFMRFVHFCFSLRHVDNLQAENTLRHCNGQNY